MHEKRSTRFLVLTRAGGNHLGEQGGQLPPISLRIIGASSGISNQPSTNTTLGIYHEEKQKNKNHDYQKQEQQTNKMLDAMY